MNEAEDLLIRLDAYIRARDLKMDGIYTYHVDWVHAQDVLRDIKQYLRDIRDMLPICELCGAGCALAPPGDQCLDCRHYRRDC